ncbi:MAG TPA: hypothetical protein VI195_10040 [Steroidobacteraceae bacterium]
MSTVPYPPQRQLSIGEVLDLSFRIYRATLVRCLLFATCGVIAGELAGIYALIKGGSLPRATGGMAAMLAQLRDPTFVTLYIVGLVLTLLFYAAVLLRERAIITGGSGDAELAVALRRLPALIGLLVLVALGFCMSFVPAAVTGGALRALLISVAAIALCYAVVAISCAQTILLIDEEGPASSLARSWRLTSGSFWRLSLIYSVALIILLALYAVIGAVAGFLAAAFAHGDVAMVTAFAQVIGIILGALATPFYAALALAVLADLKVRKEGTDLAQRISATA